MFDGAEQRLGNLGIPQHCGIRRRIGGHPGDGLQAGVPDLSAGALGFRISMGGSNDAVGQLVGTQARCK